MEENYSREEIRQIAKYQSLVCWLFFSSLILLFSSALLIGAFPRNLVAIARLVLFVFFLVYYYKLGKALKLPRFFLYIIGFFIPLVNLLVILTLLGRATKILKAQQIRVGLMGANQKDLKKYLGEMPS